MDTAKLRLVAGAVAAIFGIVGVSALCLAATLALEPVVGQVEALLVVGGGLFLIAAACLFILTRPDTATEEEVEKIGSLTADALADLPFDAVKSLIEKRPMACLAIAATTGYTMSKNPEEATRNLRRAVTGLI